MSPRGAIFVPSSIKKGTNLQHPRPPQSLNDSCGIFVYTYINSKETRNGEKKLGKIKGLLYLSPIMNLLLGRKEMIILCYSKITASLFPSLSNGNPGNDTPLRKTFGYTQINTVCELRAKCA